MGSYRVQVQNLPLGKGADACALAVAPEVKRHGIEALGHETPSDDILGEVQRLNRLGRFKEINAKIQAFDDGTVLVTFEFTETPVIRDVQAVGNRQIADAEIDLGEGDVHGGCSDSFGAVYSAARRRLERKISEKRSPQCSRKVRGRSFGADAGGGVRYWGQEGFDSGNHCRTCPRVSS